MSAFHPKRTLAGEIEKVTDARFVDDQLRLRRIVLELLPERPDRDAQIVDLTILRGSPHRAQQVRMFEHAATMLRQLGKDGIFLGRQVDSCPPLITDRLNRSIVTPAARIGP